LILPLSSSVAPEPPPIETLGGSRDSVAFFPRFLTFVPPFALECRRIGLVKFFSCKTVSNNSLRFRAWPFVETTSFLRACDPLRLWDFLFRDFGPEDFYPLFVRLFNPLLNAANRPLKVRRVYWTAQFLFVFPLQANYLQFFWEPFFLLSFARPGIFSSGCYHAQKPQLALFPPRPFTGAVPPLVV